MEVLFKPSEDRLVKEIQHCLTLPTRFPFQRRHNNLVVGFKPDRLLEEHISRHFEPLGESADLSSIEPAFSRKNL